MGMGEGGEVRVGMGEEGKGENGRRKIIFQ